MSESLAENTKIFFFNLFLPRFSKIDFVNLTVFILLSLAFWPSSLESIFSDARLWLIALFFLYCLYEFVIQNKPGSEDFLYFVAAFFIFLSVWQQWRLGFFSFKTGTIEQTILAIFSVWLLIQSLVLLLLVRMSGKVKSIRQEIIRRVDGRPPTRIAFSIGGILTVILFFFLGFSGIVPSALLGLPLIFSVDSVTEFITIVLFERPKIV